MSGEMQEDAMQKDKMQEAGARKKEQEAKSASAAPASNAFSVQNVTYHYSTGVAALEEVSLTIAAGEKVAVLGANGSGKSTLLRLLNGLAFAQSGRISAFGTTLTEANLRDEQTAYRFRRRVGFIFQNADAQLFSPTVREEIAFGPLQMGLAQDEIMRRIVDIAALVGIGNLLDRAPFQLSGGEKRKVAIASALVVNPDALLLDEPTTGLDPRSQTWLVDLLKRLHAAGKTLVTATHDLALVPELADRVFVFDEQHRLAASGPTRDIFADTDLLVRVNLIHADGHRHGSLWHAHPHPTNTPHEHSHDTL